MLAFECETYEQFRLGLCFGCGGEGGQRGGRRQCAIMGHRAAEWAATDGARGELIGGKVPHRKFYLDTGNADGQFCR